MNFRRSSKTGVVLNRSIGLGSGFCRLGGMCLRQIRYAESLGPAPEICGPRRTSRSLLSKVIKSEESCGRALAREPSDMRRNRFHMVLEGDEVGMCLYSFMTELVRFEGHKPYSGYAVKTDAPGSRH